MSPLTDAQRRVVTDLGTNFCVTSGAGCGKTRVLVARYMHVLEEDPEVPLSDLAAITFTENAAAEMRDRIRTECRRHIARARADGDTVRVRLWRQRYWDVDIAPINTIHGFCGMLLRQWPLEAGIDPNFTILDETESAFLRQETVAATVERLLEAEDADLLTVLEHFRLGEARTVLEGFLAGQRDVLRRVAGPVMAMSDEEVLRRVEKQVAERVLGRLRGVAESAEVRDALADLARDSGDADDKLEVIRRQVPGHVDRLRWARTAEVARAAAEALVGAINLRCGSAGRWPSKDAMDRAKDALRRVREPVKVALADLPDFDEPTERRHLALARALYRTACRVIASQESAKRERSALDFEDLQIRARDLLRDRPRVRDACRRRFRAILVDELQDTNFLQFEIVDLLATRPGGAGADAPLRPGALFAVGDPKQSIYRFRGAEVEVFERARGRVPEAGRTGLAESFRLHPGMAALVNRLFSRLMGETYEPVRGVSPRANETVAELHHVVNPDQERGFAAEDGHAEEARALATRLEQAVSGGEVHVWDGAAGTARPARWGDVAILLRRTTYLHLYEEALEAQGVPYYVVAGRGFYKQQEVRDVVSLLRVLVDPTDDLHLAGVLRSPFFAVSDEGLYRLKRLAPTLHAAIARAGEAEGLHPDDRRHLERAAAWLGRWTRLKDRLGLAALVDRVVFDSGYAASCVGRFGGARAYANLRRMAELARHFEQGNVWALGDFVDYVSDVMQSEMPAEQAPVEVPGTDAVRIMTVHKAKGMEFPVVVLPDLGYAPSAPRSPWFIHPAAGLAVRMRDEEGERVTSAALALARDDETEALRAESHRLLYVAMTRAKDSLIFFSHEQYTAPARPWLDDLLRGVGANRDAMSQVIALAEEGRMTVHIAPPPRRRPARGPRRGGPRDIFAGGRVRWERLRDRAARAGGADEAIRRVGGVTLPAAPPREVTATALATYRRCPRRYYWTEVLGLGAAEPVPAGDLSPLAWGTLCHRALELATSGHDAVVRRAVAMALRDVVVREEHLPGLRERLANLLRRFWDSPLGQRVRAARTANIFREMRFLTVVGDTRVRGTMDLLFQDAHGSWEVVDYKTARPPGPADAERAEAYEFQLGLYALAASRWIGRPPARWAVYYPADGTYRPEDVSEADLRRVEKQAKEILEAIAAGCYDLPKSVNCRDCDIVAACTSHDVSGTASKKTGGRL